MTLNTILLFSTLAIFISCHAQESRKTSQKATTSSGPTVIKNFKSDAIAPDFDTTLVSQYIRSIFQDSNGNLWFGTIGEGVARYDVKTLTYFSTPDGFINSTVYAINEDKQGNLWFGTDHGVYKFNGIAFRNYSQKDGLSQIDISRKGILVDKAGTVWAGTHAGVFRYNPSAEREGRQCFTMFEKLPPVNIAGIMEDKSGNIWFATSDKGVFRFDGHEVVNFAEKEALGENYAGGMAQDKAGNMWFTMKNGICRYDGKAWTEYTPRDGLVGTEFWGIYIENSGIIWVTARGSTTRFDPSLPLSDAFTAFTSADGFTCCVQSMFQDKSGRMWWGTGQGLYRFDGKRFYQVKQKGPW